MGDVKVRFKFRGVEYNGRLTKVNGAGETSVYHLMVLQDDGQYYWGKLRFDMNTKKWVFDPTPKTEGLEVLVEYFGRKVQQIT